MDPTFPAFVGLAALPSSRIQRLPRHRGCPCTRRHPPPVAAANNDNRALPPYSAKGFGASASPGRRRRQEGVGPGAAGEAGEAGEVGAAGGGDGTMGFVGQDKMGIVFTCGVCDTRISKTISRASYERGVVLIQCPGCDKRHVIADNLGHFSQLTGGKRNVEEMVGKEVTRVNTDVYNLEKLLTSESKASSQVVDVDTSAAADATDADAGDAAGDAGETGDASAADK